MCRFFYIILVVFCIVGLNRVRAEAAVNQDSYLNALENSHQTTDQKVERGDYSHHVGTGGGYSHLAPAIEHNYGPPPSPVYGAPNPIYGPQQFYGPPPHHHLIHHAPLVFHPREHWFFDKFKFKLNLFTIGKILLKLIIFKKIVKFIALICLLLFLPKLHPGKDEDEIMGSEEDLRRSFAEKENLEERIQEVTRFAKTAFHTFARKYNDGCDRGQIWCRLERTIDTIDNKYPYEKIVDLYLPNIKAGERIEENEVAPMENTPSN